MATDLDVVFQSADAMIASRSLDIEMDFDYRDMLRHIDGLVSVALGNLSNLSADDPVQNEEALRLAVVDAALTAFVAGMMAAPPGGAQSTEGEVVVTCSDDDLKSIAWSAMRHGVVTLHLVSAEPNESAD